MTTKAFKKLIEEDNCIILDIRPPGDFADHFIPESIYFSFEYQLDWLKHFIKKEQNIVFVVDDVSKKKLENSLQKHLPGMQFKYQVYPFASWKKEENPQDIIITIDPDELALDMPHDDNLLPVDVRTIEEYNSEHISGAYNLPADELMDPGVIAMLPEMANLYFYCNDGIRSLFAASVFKSQGLHNARVVFANWKDIRKQEGLTFEKTKVQTNQEPEGI